VHLIGDLITGAGGNGVYASATDLTIADGVIEQSQNYGADIDTANYVSITANYIDHNGKSSAANYQSIQIKNSSHVSVCANHIQGSGEGLVSGFGNYTSHVFFDGPNDDISFCGNAYTADNLPINIGVTPQYVYDAGANATLTASGIYENPGTQAVGVFSPNTAAILPSIQTPHAPAGFISGLTLSNHPSSAQAVHIAPGEASDSTGSATMVLTHQCNVNLAASALGLNGLDAGTAGSVAPNTTYFFYLVANPGGGNPGCIASLSANGPAFTAASFAGTGFQTLATGATNTGYSTSTIFNVSPATGAGSGIAGAAPGSTVTATSGMSTVASSAISSFSNSATQTISGFTWSPGSGTMSWTGGSTIYLGMQIADDPTTGGSCLPNNTYVTNISGSGPYTLTLSANFPPMSTCHNSGTGSAYLSYGQQIVVGSGGVTGNSDLASLTINNGLYRLVGALYTDGSSDIVKFTQDGNTFYLNTPVEDITPTSCALSGSTASVCQLSVPCGAGATCASGQNIQVEAFGRIVGGTSSQVILNSFDQGTQKPDAFSAGAPGFMSQSSGADTGTPFRAYTSVASGTTPGSVRLRANLSGTSPTTAYEVTDGWVFKP
jgi:hypothetical protein